MVSQRTILIGILAAGVAAIWAGTGSATTMKEFFDSNTDTERGVGIVIGITTQAYRYSASGDNDTASCIMKKFRISTRADGEKIIPGPLLELVADISENKDRSDQHIEGYIVSYVDHHCPPPE